MILSRVKAVGEGWGKTIPFILSLKLFDFHCKCYSESEMIPPHWNSEYTILMPWLITNFYLWVTFYFPSKTRRNTRCLIPQVITNWYWNCITRLVVKYTQHNLPFQTQSHNLILRLFSGVYFNHFSHSFLHPDRILTNTELRKARKIFTLQMARS